MSEVIRRLPSCLLVLAVTMVSGCNDDSDGQELTVDQGRSGTPLESVSKKFVEDKLHISDNGARLAFISGKDSPAEGPFQFKAFYVDWDTAPAAPARLTGSDVGEELDVELAGNGLRALLTVAQNGQTDVYTVVPGDTATLARITNDTVREQGIALSTDGAFAAYVTTQSSGSSQLTVVAIGDGTEANFTSSLLSGANYVEVYFVPNSTYQMILVERNLTTFATVISSLTFSSLADLAEANKTTLASDIDYQRRSLVVSTTRLAYIDNDTDKTIVNARGNYEYTEEVPVDTAVKQSETRVVDLTTLANSKFRSEVGYGVKDLSINTAGDFMFNSLSFFNRCFASDFILYGQATATRTVSDAALGEEGLTVDEDPTVEIKAIAETAGEKSFAAQYCKAKPDESETEEEAEAKATPNPTFDNRVEQIALNKDATASRYRVAYITREADVYYSSCFKKIGDPEIRLVDVNGETVTFTNLIEGQNRAPLVDETPEGATCP